MPASRDEVIAYLLGLRLDEVSALVEILEAELGEVASTYGVAVTEPTPPSMPLRVVLRGWDAARRVELIRTLRAALGLPLREAVALIEQAPSTLATRQPDEAAQLQRTVEAAGGRVRLQPADYAPSLSRGTS